MATAFIHAQAHPILSGETTRPVAEKKVAKRGTVIGFFSDFIEDIFQKPLQPAAEAKHDMFREHILAMSITYFAFILVLIAVSLPILAILKY
jgi:hypothetical protein